MADNNYYYAVGRRKEAIATARLYTEKGPVLVNDMPLEEYFGHPELSSTVTQALDLLDKNGAYKVTIKVKSGGKSGQAEAARLAVANALVVMSEDLRPTLKRAGLLKRDARIKERKKYGLKRARKAPQFTKR